MGFFDIFRRVSGSGEFGSDFMNRVCLGVDSSANFEVKRDFTLNLVDIIVFLRDQRRFPGLLGGNTVNMVNVFLNSKDALYESRGVDELLLWELKIFNLALMEMSSYEFKNLDEGKNILKGQREVINSILKVCSDDVLRSEWSLYLNAPTQNEAFQHQQSIDIRINGLLRK